MAEKREIEIALKSGKAETSADRLNKKVKGVGTSADKSEKSMFNLSKTAVGVGKALAVSAGAGVASMVALSNAVSDYSKEIKVASQLSGVSVEKLQLMAHATNTVGIGIEDLGDKFKDTREKIGDFLNTGGGGFMDFVDALKLTKAEARDLAKEFSVLSGDQILQKMVTRMEAGNVSAVQMSHALEGMASDATKLIPLLSNSGAEMKRLTDNMSNLIVPLTDDDIDLFIRMGQSTDIAAGALKSLGEQILVDLGEHFIKAANKASFFYASLNKGTEAQKTTRLVEIADEIEAIRENYEHLDNWFNKAISSEEGFNEQQQEGADKVNALLKERIEIQKELAASRFGIGETSPSTSTGGKVPSGGGGEGGGTGEDDRSFNSLVARLQLETEAIRAEEEVRREFRAGLLTEQELNNALAMQGIFFQYESRRAAILENEKLTAEQKAELINEINQQEIAAEAAKQAGLTGETQKGTDERSAIEQQAWMQNKNMAVGALAAGLTMTLAANKKMTKEQKKQAKQSIAIQTAASIARAYGENNFYVASGMAVFLAGMGLIQTNRASTASGISAPSTASPTASASPPPSVSNQSQNRVIQFTGLENFGPNDFIPMTKSQFIDYMGQDEDVNIAVNAGQQNATRVGAI